LAWAHKYWTLVDIDAADDESRATCLQKGCGGYWVWQKWTEMNNDDGGDTQKFAQRGAVEIA